MILRRRVEVSVTDPRHTPFSLSGFGPGPVGVNLDHKRESIGPLEKSRLSLNGTPGWLSSHLLKRRLVTRLQCPLHYSSSHCRRHYRGPCRGSTTWVWGPLTGCQGTTLPGIKQVVTHGSIEDRIPNTAQSTYALTSILIDVTLSVFRFTLVVILKRPMCSKKVVYPIWQHLMIE